MATASSATVEPIGLSQERIQRNLALHRAAAVADYDACVALLQPSQQEHEHEPIDTWYEDPQQHAWSALHFAADVGSLPIVKLLLKHGAIWNAVDAFGTTAAEVAWSRNHNKCYEAIFNEGVRQTVLLNLLERKDDQQQSQTQDEQPELEPEIKRQKLADQSQGTATRTDPSAITLQAPANELTNSNTDFLASKLDFFPDKAGKMRCLDQDGNMVMADWESDIMQLSAELICKDQQPGFSALNVGFGLGIVDTFIQNYKPGRHVIIEPHPDALAYMRKLGWHNKPGVEIFEGRWEDWIRDDDSDESIEKMTQLGSFDAIYWDTYSQDYKGAYYLHIVFQHVLSD